MCCVGHVVCPVQKNRTKTTSSPFPATARSAYDLNRIASSSEGIFYPCFHASHVFTDSCVLRLICPVSQSLDPAQLAAPSPMELAAVDRIAHACVVLMPIDVCKPAVLPVLLQYVQRVAANGHLAPELRASSVDAMCSYTQVLSGQVRKSAGTITEFMRTMMLTAGSVSEFHEAEASDRDMLHLPWFLFNSALESLSTLVELVGDRKAVAPLIALMSDFVKHDTWNMRVRPGGGKWR